MQVALYLKLFIQMTTIELLTKKDLDAFKQDLITELKSILQKGESTRKEWLKSIEVRKLLKISSGSLQNLRINGQLRYTKIGGILYYKYDDINQLMESGYSD